MKLQEITTPELRRILRATERDVGSDATEVRILRRELVKREQQARQTRRRRRKGDTDD